MTGKVQVTVAAMTQWMNQPNAWPLARTALGKISEMNTQITEPWEKAKNAIWHKIAPRRKMGLRAPRLPENSRATRARHAAMPADPTSIRTRRPKRSMMNMAAIVNNRIVPPMATDWSMAELRAAPAMLKIFGA